MCSGTKINPCPSSSSLLISENIVETKLTLKVSKFRKQIVLFSFEPKTVRKDQSLGQKYFVRFFGSNENGTTICFRNLLTFKKQRMKSITKYGHNFRHRKHITIYWLLIISKYLFSKKHAFSEALLTRVSYGNTSYIVTKAFKIVSR